MRAATLTAPLVSARKPPRGCRITAARALFGGGNAEAKARIGQLEYALQTEIEHGKTREEKLRALTEEHQKALSRLEVFEARCAESGKEIFKLERQLEETTKGFENGMAVARRQIKTLEGKLLAAEATEAST